MKDLSISSCGLCVDVKINYKFKDLSNKDRFVDTVLSHGYGTRVEIEEVFYKYVEEVVEAWDGDELFLYMVSTYYEGLRTVHAYKIGKGRVKDAIAIYKYFLSKIPGRVFSWCRQSNKSLVKLYPLLRFAEIGRVNDEIIYERKEGAVSV